ncbi:hypothetical protein [Siccirubricoccus sp. G192]|uniref:hypothetical protein n=1 Tax=Siccirubricoccus sp. G192 TaxID=2849651 RepID=UPI001C2B84E0|nr:hypothetical protein [Siccirubricoccus sp. G192]MBV1800496.1 hypothetical protein [Siccirubricoccus sp. G192]
MDDLKAVRVDARDHHGKSEADFRIPDGRQVTALPLPLRHSGPQAFSADGNGFLLDWRCLPERPSDSLVPDDDAQRRATALLDRVKAVWARIREVEEALATPAAMWQCLQDIWLHGTQAEPEMDLIVRQARELPPCPGASLQGAEASAAAHLTHAAAGPSAGDGPEDDALAGPAAWGDHR